MAREAEAGEGLPGDSQLTVERWRSTWTALGIPITPALLASYDSLIARYSEPHRRYHTVRHLDECFAKLAEIRGEAERPAEVEVALWFHDAIYEQRASDNEARSAELAAREVKATGGREDVAQRIAELVLATRHAALPHSVDAKVVVDVDLSILGAPAERFDEYERQVREEDSWVPDFLFKRERRKIMNELLARPAIFATPLFFERYEQQARANLRRSIGQL
jgi:predicted metal-dependent HD superfamily phosphohydrolase